MMYLWHAGNSRHIDESVPTLLRNLVNFKLNGETGDSQLVWYDLAFRQINHTGVGLYVYSFNGLPEPRKG